MALRPCECSFCGLHFKRKSSLNAHIDAVHKRERLYCCCVCEYSSGHLSHFKAHAKTHENSEEIIENALKSIPNYCPKCKKFFKYDHALTEHMALEHNHVKPYSCDICDVEFKKLQNYKQHMERHRARGTITCSQCGEEFDTPAALATHQRDEHKKKHKCEVCGAVFARMWNLKEHQKIHEGDKVARRTFTCPFEGCGSKFTRKSNLNTHLDVVHGGVQPHVCPVCGKDFRFASLLERHMLRHDSEEPEVIEMTEEMLVDDGQTDLQKEVVRAANS